MKTSLRLAAALIFALGSAAGPAMAAGAGALALKGAAPEASLMIQVRDDKGKDDKSAKSSTEKTVKGVAGKLLEQAVSGGDKKGGDKKEADKGGDKDKKGKDDKSAKSSTEKTVKSVAGKLLEQAVSGGDKKGGDKKGGGK